jgi:short/branched chain acyl-CoA dehydrogenase
LEEFGGSAMNFTSAILVVEELSRVELSRVDPSVSIMVDIHNTLTKQCSEILGVGYSQRVLLKRNGFLDWPLTLIVSLVSSFALSEAGSGPDAFTMKTTATPSIDGSFYILNGEKLWI